MKYIFNLNYRNIHLTGFIACLIILGSAYFIQYFFHQEPCSLCLLQRYAFWVLSLILLIAGLHNPKNHWTRYSYGTAALLFVVLGLFFSLRQVWIQNLPEGNLPNCTAGLDRLLQYLPLFEAVKTVITGGGECAHTNFKILGLTLADAASLIFFGFFIFIFSIFYLDKKRRI